MCPLSINGESLEDRVFELKKLLWKQPIRLTDIFNTQGLRISENVHIRAFGNKPYLTIFIHQLKDGVIYRTATVSPVDFLNNTYLRMDFSESLVTLLNDINVRFCSDLKLAKQEPITQFRVIKQEEIKPMLMLKCPKTENYQRPFNCTQCFYFVEMLDKENVCCSYHPFSLTNKQQKGEVLKPVPHKHLTSKPSHTVLTPKQH